MACTLQAFARVVLLARKFAAVFVRSFDSFDIILLPGCVFAEKGLGN